MYAIRSYYEYYDLTAGQQLLLFSQTFTIHKQINNIFTSILLEKKLDFDVLKSAIEYAYEQNDAFRLRMTNRITSYNVCYTKLLRYKQPAAQNRH